MEKDRATKKTLALERVKISFVFNKVIRSLYQNHFESNLSKFSIFILGNECDKKYESKIVINFFFL